MKEETLETLETLTAVTSLMAHSCSSLTFSTKNGVMPIEETWRRGEEGPSEGRRGRGRQRGGEGGAFRALDICVVMCKTAALCVCVFVCLTCRMVVSVSNWISSNSEMLVTTSHTLLYSMMMTRCL